MATGLVVKEWDTEAGLTGCIFVTKGNRLELTVMVHRDQNEFWGKSPASKLGEELGLDLCGSIMSALDPRWQQENVWHVGYRAMEAMTLKAAVDLVEDLAYDVVRLGAKAKVS